MRLTERGRWVLIYLPACLLMEAGAIVGPLLLGGPDIFRP